MELSGKTLGIIGYGQIGRATAKIAVAMGMNVIANARHRFEDEENGMVKYAELNDVLKNSDVISLHCPLFESTKNMINKDTISQMKDKAILINTSRGPLVCEKDVFDALKSGKLGYYAADVVSTEPIEKDNVLLKAKNCIITPHIAWAPIEARKRLMEASVANLQAFILGKPQNVVNK